MAELMQSQLNESVNKAEPLANEVKVFSDGGPLFQKDIDQAASDADAEEKGLPPVPKIAPPQGKAATDQYEAAIQITGDVRKVQQDADVKAGAIRDKKGAVEEHANSIENLSKKAAANAAKLADMVGPTSSISSIYIVEEAAKAAKELADASKKKADQAAKDKSADAGDLAKTAKEDAAFSARAQSALTQANAAVAKLKKYSEDADTGAAKLKKLTETSKTALEARKKQVSELDAKLKPYGDAVDAAKKQEDDIKKNLNEKDIDTVLTKKYAALGGDEELSKVLADEDKAFETASEKGRVTLKDWYKDTTQKLDDYKPLVEGSQKRCEQTVPKAEEWLKREEPLADQTKKAAEALGNKLDTPLGKELMYEISQQTDVIAKVKQAHDDDKAELEKANAAKTALDERYRALSQQNSAGEKYIEDRRTETNNLLQMENMSLEQKVDYLQRKPKAVRERVQKQMEAEIGRITRMSASKTDAQVPVFTPAPDTSMPAPIDWKSINDKITKYQGMSVDDMKKDDPAAYDMQQEYLKAGGDQALLEKRVDEWKAKENMDEFKQKQAGDDYLKRSEQMRGDYDKANKEASEARKVKTQQKEYLAAKEAQFADLQKKIDPKLLPRLDGLSDKEQVQYELLEKEIKRLKANEDNLVGVQVMGDFGKNTASALVEKDRQLYEQMQGRHKKPLPKPTSDEIQKMPLRAKYTELTGKTAP